jgi:hypothetical protein
VAIVHQLADEWGTTCQRHGKTVTACFRPTAPGTDAQSHGD